MDRDPVEFTPLRLHRALAWRLALAAGLLSLLIGSLATYTLRERFIELVDAVSRVAALRVNAQLLPLLDTPARLTAPQVQQQLNTLGDGRRADLPQGRFVLVRVYDPAGQLLAELQDAPAALPFQATVSDSDKRPRLLRSGAQRFLLVSQPLLDSRQQPVLRLEAVFAVAAEALASYRWQVTRTILLTLAVIAATSLLLYPLLVTLLRRVLTLTDRLLKANLDTIQVLGGAIAKRDSDTDDHNYRVSLYCVALGEALALPRPAVLGLIKGAFLHDVGKIGIHDQILLKPGKLDAEEFAQMRRHVEFGLDIVRRCDWLADALEVVGGHHEKYDGSGYPAGLHGEAIPLNARIFAVTDVFDALTSRRPYKEPLPLGKALAILAEGRGNHFDPTVVDTFTRLAPELHTRYGSCPPEQLQADMARVVERYFMPQAASAS